MNTQKQIFLIVVLFFAFVGGCSAYAVFDIPHRAQEQANHLQDQSVERGALLFANNCRTCHGISGEGIIGPQLNTDGFKNQDPLVLAQTKAMLNHTISCGRAGTQMPTWLDTNGGSLSQEQINHLVDFLTEPVDPSITGPDGKPTSQGWLDAYQFAQNINRPATALIGGDSLDSIAQGHLIGYSQLAAANGNVPIDQKLKPGTIVHFPGFKAMPQGYDYHVYNDNETIRKIVDNQHYGAVILADLNNFAYSYSLKLQAATFSLTENGQDIPGLFPGTVVKLPQGAEYVVVATDTLQSIATRQGVSLDDMLSLNPTFADFGNDKALPSAFTLKLPDNATYTVKAGQAAAAIASLHNVSAADLLQANGLTEASILVPGTKLKLPAGANYVVQSGDTIAQVAEQHNMSADALAQLNGLKANDPISPQVVLKMPAIDHFIVQGQTLTDLAKGYSGAPNDIANDFAKTNNIPVDAILRVGQSLQVPLDSAGTVPPGTINDGAACVQYAVPNNIYQAIPGVSTATATVTAPAAVSKTVEIDSHADDWTVTADGTAQPANKGVVTVAKGTAVTFNDKQGLHTITINGKQDGDNFKQGETRTITFNDAGQFKITCDFHPAMLADVFVQ
ncbi:MAG TPA: LysM peptidoglycan-binding domain-containing protein [Tepidiformaceae bacterium]|nr:LysM peptidoglycan-binding domain-containing protein [Tepidiformaceae bacterium]